MGVDSDTMASQHLGVIEGPDGQLYSLEFYGEHERAAVIAGPVPMGEGRLVEVPEGFRAPASTSAEALDVLKSWLRARGWTGVIRRAASS